MLGSIATTTRLKLLGTSARDRRFSSIKSSDQSAPGVSVNSSGQQFLAAYPGVFVGRDNLAEKRRRQIGPVLIRRPARHNDIVALGRAPQELAKQFDRPRRGADHLPRMLPQPQPKLQIVPRLFDIAESCQFVDPGRPKLWTTQSVRFFRRKQRSLATVRPNQPALRRFVGRPVPRSGVQIASNPDCPST